MIQLKRLANNCYVVITDINTIYGFSYEMLIGVYNKDTNEFILNKETLGYSYTTQKHIYLFCREYSGYNVHTQQDLDVLINKGIIIVKTY